MLPYLLSSFFLFIIGLFNLLGIHPALFRSQLIFGIVGVVCFLLVKKIGTHFFRINSKAFYWSFIILLVITFLLGFEVKGSKRWIDFHFFSFQASEFFKVFFILFLADYFNKNRRNFKEVSFFIRSLIYFAIPTFIVFKQPDLGNAIVYSVIFFTMALFSGIPRATIAKAIAPLFFLIPLGWIFLKDYQKLRILSFLSPHLDKAGNSYNMIQAIVTVGSGKFTGRGLGRGTQSGLFFLPENHTDFAFSSLTEQFGFIGGEIVIILYLLFALILIKKIITYSYQKDDASRFQFLFCVGFLAYFLIQVFINIGMNMGILPITGITLPLISYGGSSLLTWMIGLALLP